MGKKVYFLDSIKQSDGSYNNTYGVDDINAIVSNLVGAGIAPFPSADTYDVSELNSLTSTLVAEGTSLDGLKVSFADNKIHISQGIGYFENGATIVVDSEGEELEYSVAETLYVYAEYNQALNVCGFYTSESEPVSSTGIYVLMLATISADGIVTDKRNIAQSKIATMGRNIMVELFSAPIDPEDSRFTVTTYEKNYTFWEGSLDCSKFNKIIVLWFYDGDSQYNAIDISDLVEGENLLRDSHYNSSTHGAFYAEVTNGKLTRIYNGTKYSLSCHGSVDTSVHTSILLL